MLFAIDIGNSYITLGAYDGKKLVFVSELVTLPKLSRDQYAVEILNVMRLYDIKAEVVTGAIISSVVPELTSVLQSAIKLLCDIDPLIVGPGVKSGLPITIDNPAQLGPDLVACGVAAVARGKMPCIIYDLGTTTTVSVIDGEGKFSGVVISAGVGTTLEMFTSHTALLPHVSIEAPKTVIGKNSIHSMQSGLVYGTAAMLDGLSGRISKELEEEPVLLATGSMAHQIVPYCQNKVELCEHLLLEGLRLIYERNSRLKK
jgi:type III pantothenate kinase